MSDNDDTKQKTASELPIWKRIPTKLNGGLARWSGYLYQRAHCWVFGHEWHWWYPKGGSPRAQCQKCGVGLMKWGLGGWVEEPKKEECDAE